MPPFVANENFVTTLLIFDLELGPGGDAGLVVGFDVGFDFEISVSFG